MSKPVGEWDEAYILSLPKENNVIERKGSKKLDLRAGADENGVLDELAKQLSAFANTGGGKLIYGLKDDGTVDSGGVSTQVKNGTKEWLERRIPEITDYEILGFNVHEFEPKSPGSQIQHGKAIYIVDVPDSDRAPHQSTRDMKYYVRLGSQSLPASHKLIEDIRNRQKHPNVSLADIKLEISATTLVGQDLSLYAVDVMLSLSIANNGSLKSADTFLLMKPEQGQFGQGFDRDIVTFVRGTKSGQYMWRLNQALPPQSEISFRADFHFQAKATFHPNFGKQWIVFDVEEALSDIGSNFYVEKAPSNLSDLAIEWTVFADSAPVRTGRVAMSGIGLIEKLNQATR